MEAGKIRIISGAFGGRQLGFPSGAGIRPSSGRVREAAFSAIESRMDLEGARVLDLFAGSGALGFEALSRGAQSAVFVERDPNLVAALRKNSAALGAGGRTEVFGADAEQWLRERCGGPAAGTGPIRAEAFDLVFADPPYYSGFAGTVPRLVAGGRFLTPSGIFFFECGRREQPSASEEGVELLEPLVKRTAGDTSFFLFRMTAPGAKDPAEPRRSTNEEP